MYIRIVTTVQECKKAWDPLHSSPIVIDVAVGYETGSPNVRGKGEGGIHEVNEEEGIEYSSVPISPLKCRDEKFHGLTVILILPPALLIRPGGDLHFPNGVVSAPEKAIS